MKSRGPRPAGASRAGLTRPGNVNGRAQFIRLRAAEPCRGVRPLHDEPPRALGPNRRRVRGPVVLFEDRETERSENNVPSAPESATNPAPSVTAVVTTRVGNC